MTAVDSSPIPEAEPAKKSTAADIRALLRVRFAPPAWALLFEVADATGFKATRSADAIAMSLWPSRGLELHGLEIKVNRGDWLKELKEPNKAETIARFCDRWWIVAAPDVVRPGELPAGWGLLVAKGGRLVAVTEAPALCAESISREFLAALMRRVGTSTMAGEDLEAEIARRVDAAVKREVALTKQWRERDKNELEKLTKALSDFEIASGVRIHEWDGGKIGEAVHIVMAGGLKPLANAAERMREIAARVTRDLDALIAHANSEEKEPG